MPSGLQIFNADGSLQFDTTNRVMRFLTVISTGTSNGSAPVSGLNQGTPVAIVGSNNESNNNSPNVTFSGDTVSWNWGSIPSDSRTNNNINVMVY